MQTQCIAERSSELPLMHIQNESVDTRARGLTINPMIQTKSDDDESGVGEGTGENGDGRDSGLTAVELGSGEEETGQSAGPGRSHGAGGTGGPESISARLALPARGHQRPTPL